MNTYFRRRKRTVKKLLLSTVVLLIVFSLSCLTLIGAMSVSLKNTKNETPWTKVKLGHSNMYSENGYTDYAKNVYFDTETYSELDKQGLFWVKWNNESQAIDQIDADSKEGAALICPEKPTIILVHGMLTDGYYHAEPFYLNSNAGLPSELNLDTANVPLALLWIKAGWNVGYFHYNKFAAEVAPFNIEGKIWGTDGPVGMRYKKLNAEFVDNASEYSLAEHFAAEYIRAMQFLPKSMGDNEIRVAAHSMGGELSTAGIFLLTELANEGQLPYKQLPDRFAMLDPYFGTLLINDEGTVLVDMSPKNTTIRWSGKPLVDGRVGVTMADCLKDIRSAGVAIEYYAFTLSFLVVGIPSEVQKAILDNAVYTMLIPDYSEINPDYNYLTDGHNGVRDWYLCSIFGYTPKDVTDIDNPSTIAASALTPTSVIRSMRGIYFEHNSGYSTICASDDTFVRIPQE